VSRSFPIIRRCFVKGPKCNRKIGVTPIMEAKELRLLLDSIPVTRRIKIPKEHGGGYKEVADIKGLRDRAAIRHHGLYLCPRNAVVGLKCGDYRLEGKRARLRACGDFHHQDLTRPPGTDRDETLNVVTVSCLVREPSCRTDR